MIVHPIPLARVLLPMLGVGLGFALLWRRARAVPPAPRLPMRAQAAPPRPRRSSHSPRAGALGFGLIPPAAFWDAERSLDDELDDAAEVAADSRSMSRDTSRFVALVDPSEREDRSRLDFDDADDPAEIAADSRSMISDASRFAAAGPDDEEGRKVPW